MEKLLHERLREQASRNEYIHGAASYFGVGLKDGIKYGDMFDDLLLFFADEIERYYIPRPRFEDGEPVKFGANGEEILWEGEESRLVFNAINVKGVPIAIGTNEAYARAEMTDDGFVKRPTPKVYDADVVEIKVGDTIFYQETGNEYTVVKLDQKDEYHALLKSSIDGKEQWHCIARFTHECPVFDAEGVRICKGDTVYDIEDEDKYTVSKVNSSNGKVFFEEGGYMSSHYLSHREPDSLKKLRDDMKHDNYTGANFQPRIASYVDRLTALIERGA